MPETYLSSLAICNNTVLGDVFRGAVDGGPESRKVPLQSCTNPPPSSSVPPRASTADPGSSDPNSSPSPRLHRPPTADLSGKTALVTGGSTGLGREACEQFLALGLSRLVLAVRSPARGEQVAARLRAAHPGATVDVWPLEMSSPASVAALARRVSDELSMRGLDIAVLNAGVAAASFRLCPETGREEDVQVNYLSTLLLGILLLPVLRRRGGGGGGGPGRLTIVGSAQAYGARLPDKTASRLLASLDDERAWDAAGRYACSKMPGHLALARLAGLVDPRDVVVNIVSPGFCKGSELGREARGAAVVKGRESHGCFVSDWEIRP